MAFGVKLVMAGIPPPFSGPTKNMNERGELPMRAIQKTLPLDQIDFDKANPRIKAFLQKYGDEVNDSRIRFALRSSMEDSSPGSSSFLALKGSIRAAKGISIPITVYENGDRYVCIDGNTRLLIYHELAEEGVSGDWKTIRAQVLDGPGRKEIETVRMTAHLVGAREWPAYEKARFLHELHYDQFMDPDQLVTICGGNKKQIQQQIDAYQDMNRYYREPNPDEAFQMDRFSGFVELQKKGIKEAIFDAGFELEEFGNWIRDGQIYRLQDVRKLPRVLANEEAKEKFVCGSVRSIEAASEIADAKRRDSGEVPSSQIRIQDASLGVLAEALLDKIDQLPRNEFNALRDRTDDEARDTVEALAALVDPLTRLLDDV